MGTRIVTASVLIAVVLLWLFVADYPIFAIGALAVYALSANELAPLLGFKNKFPFLIAAALAASCAFYFAPPGLFVQDMVPQWVNYLMVMSLFFWCLLLPVIKAYPLVPAFWMRPGVNFIFGLLLLLPFLMALLVLRAHRFATDFNCGALLLLAVMVLVWAADSGAYFTGRAVGKTKLIPEVSPNKTREGLYGGLALALLALALLDYLGLYGDYSVDKLALTVAGIGAIIFSVEGDLAESMLKRRAGIKDSGRIFPGHGGMLDRIDSQLAALPVFLGLHFILEKVLV